MYISIGPWIVQNILANRSIYLTAVASNKGKEPPEEVGSDKEKCSRIGKVQQHPILIPRKGWDRRFFYESTRRDEKSAMDANSEERKKGKVVVAAEQALLAEGGEKSALDTTERERRKGKVVAEDKQQALLAERDEAAAMDTTKRERRKGKVVSRRTTNIVD